MFRGRFEKRKRRLQVFGEEIIPKRRTFLGKGTRIFLDDPCSRGLGSTNHEEGFVPVRTCFRFVASNLLSICLRVKKNWACFSQTFFFRKGKNVEEEHGRPLSLFFELFFSNRQRGSNTLRETSVFYLFFFLFSLSNRCPGCRTEFFLGSVRNRVREKRGCSAHRRINYRVKPV